MAACCGLQDTLLANTCFLSTQAGEYTGNIVLFKQMHMHVCLGRCIWGGVWGYMTLAEDQYLACGSFQASCDIVDLEVDQQAVITWGGGQGLGLGLGMCCPWL